VVLLSAIIACFKKIVLIVTVEKRYVAQGCDATGVAHCVTAGYTIYILSLKSWFYFSVTLAT
jgi:hypothetical protein